ncbi:Transcription factor DIVARICATA [Arachis hypogaea]|uniref:Transcription factor DIVARICATA n=1 Tax=Arachis hypogaea TaxID=3818 RepID=A0A6B9VD56_ARAHY|nr:Transcription factor DIVARICATA [Arachis hypogaea]
MSEEELGTFSTMDPWDMIDLLDTIDPFDMIDLYADMSNNQSPQPQPDRRNMVEQCAIDVGGNQPPQLQPPPHSQPKSQPKTQPDVREITVAQFFVDTCGYQPHQSHPQFDMVVAECLPEAQPQAQSHPHPQQFQQFLADVCGYQPPESQPQSQPQPQPRPQQFLTDMCGYQPPWSQPQPQSHPHPQQFQQFLADVCGYQPPESQLQLQPMQPQIWTWEENKAFESVIANCFHYTKHDRWELIAARLPGKTPAQLQECFKKLMKDINVIHNGYTANTPLNAASENMTMTMAAPATTLEHNPVSIPIINATTTPPPPPYNTDHQHHRAEVVVAAAEKAAPMEAATREQNQSSNPNNTKKFSRWTEDEHSVYTKEESEATSISISLFNLNMEAKVVLHSEPCGPNSPSVTDSPNCV